jgi:putative flippase GtrA
VSSIGLLSEGFVCVIADISLICFVFCPRTALAARGGPWFYGLCRVQTELKIMSRAVDIYMSRVMLLLENRNLRNQLFKFIVTGFCGVFTDLGVYRMLVHFGTHVSSAKALGCIFGTVVVFFINRAWTFSVQQRSAEQIFKFVFLYTLTTGLNTLLNTLALKFLSLPWQVIFVAVTALTTAVNFLGSKFFVFRTKPDVFTADPDFDGSLQDKAALP